jgi:NAD(P)-dependent dehydrogenase (short-subunit alcohol dehydrogenase family)
MTGRVALVTGAAQGFGADIARALAEEGARLLLTDLSEGVHAVAADLGAISMIADVAKPEDHRAMVERAVSEYGQLDLAINNAGIVHPPMPLAKVPEDMTRRIIEVDLLGMAWALQAQIPVMRKQGGGVIVNIASVAGLVGAPGLGIYAAAKHGVVGLTRTAAAECARDGIRINAICPAFARTAMVDDLLAQDPAAEAALVRGVPMRRVADRAEIVQAVIWAASPENSFMTGQAIAVDGGITAI